MWIATSFREEHRQAIDWLNEQTRENIRFFGIELKVARIGTSLPAPLFNLVVQPNDWQKQVRSATRSGKVGTKTAPVPGILDTLLGALEERTPGLVSSADALESELDGLSLTDQRDPY